MLQSVYGGHDVFAWFPTGYGKSLCYQLLPYMIDVKLGLTKAAPSERSVVYSNFSSSERRILPPLYSAVYYGRVYKIFYIKYPEIIAHAHNVYQASSLSLGGLGTRLTSSVYLIGVGSEHKLPSRSASQP